MGLRKKLKKNICKFLLKQDIFTSKKVPDYKVKQILELIKPKKINIEHIRIGGNNDGGYLLPNDFEGIEFCFSPGVGNISYFEKDLAKKNIKSFLADYSVDNKFENDSMINFEKKFLGPTTHDNYISIKDWMMTKINYEKENELILQMDIEGDEYDVLHSIDFNTLKKFRIILIEFHNLHYLFEDFFHNKIEKIFNKLSQLFVCTHIHPNNDVDFVINSKALSIPPVMEFTFLRKDRAEIVNDKLFFPNNLDQPNNPNKRDLVLPKCWFC